MGSAGALERLDVPRVAGRALSHACEPGCRGAGTHELAKGSDMIALIDYGMGNLSSVRKALEHVGAGVRLTDDPAVILAADKVVLPGVGAFGDGMKGMREGGLVQVVKEVAARGTPLLGICVGMQVLFEVGEERGEHEGLGILPGRVRQFQISDFGFQNLKIPQTGWNQIEPQKERP